MTARSRNWCFTLNNYTEDEYTKLSTQDKQVKYIIFGKEKGEQEETPHLQGFIIFHNAKTFNQVKAFLGDRFHIEKTVGTPAQNIAYCSKDNEYVELGEVPSQGQRRDIKEVKEMVNQGKSMYEISQVATSYQSIRMAEMLMKYKPVGEREKPTVKWYYGKTGTGKSREAWKELGYEGTWVNSNTLQWFDLYEGQENVIIDDFRGNQCTFAFLLRLLDRYPMRVPVKGSFVPWVPKVIIITSTHHPRDVYKNEDIQENIEQLIRRLDIIQEFV